MSTSTRRAERQGRLVLVLGAVVVGAALWLTLTAAAVLSYVYGGLGCRGWECLGW
jgi:hypothetical protein